MRKARKYIALLVCALMCLTVLRPLGARASGDKTCKIGDVEYETVYDAYEQAKEADGADGRIITLIQDVTMNEKLTIDSGTDSLPIVLDLNGHELHATNGKCIFEVQEGCYFTIDDTSVGKNGSILGTDSSEEKKSVIINNGFFKFNGGTIKNFEAEFGGAIYNNGTLVIEKGNIRTCTATKKGGGVYNNGTFTMHNGEITDCLAFVEGGGVYNNGTMNVGRASSEAELCNALIDRNKKGDGSGPAYENNVYSGDNINETPINVIGDFNGKNRSTS